MISLKRQMLHAKLALRRCFLHLLATVLRKKRVSTSLPLHVHIGHHFWGMGNVGDDFMLAGFIQGLGPQTSQLRLSCCSTGNLALLSTRFPQIEWRPYTWLHRLALLSKADIWLGLGGTPFQTDSGPWMEQHLDEERTLCVGLRLPMYFLGVGVGNVDALRRRAFQRIIQTAAYIWTRDEMTYALLAHLAPGRVTLGADLANVLFHHVSANMAPPPSKAGMGLLLSFEALGVFTWEKLQACLDSWPATKTWWLIQEQRHLTGSENATWGAMPPALRQRLHHSAPCWEATAVADLLLSWRFPSDVASSRYHGALWAAWQGCRLIVITRNEKIEGLAHDLKLPKACPQADWSQPSLLSLTKPVAPELLEGLAEKAHAALNEWLHKALQPNPNLPRSFRHIIYHLTLTAFKNWPVKRPQKHFSLTILKLDKIGDSVLALGAMRLLVSHFGETQTLFITSTLAAPLLRLEFPKASLEVMPAFCERYFPDFVCTLAKHASSLRAISTRLLVCLRHQPSDYLHSISHLVNAEKVISARWHGTQENTSLHFPRAEQVPYADRLHSDIPEDTKLCLELKTHQRLSSHILNTSVSNEEVLPCLRSTSVSKGAHLLVCPAAGSELREYPPVKLAQALRLLQKTQPDISLRICLQPGTSQKALQQALEASEITNVEWMFPPDIQTLLHEIATAGAVLALESAPAHLATAMDKAGVFLIGGGHYGLCAPWSKSQRQQWLSSPLPCYGCNWKCVQSEPLCITQITPEAICQALIKALTD